MKILKFLIILIVACSCSKGDVNDSIDPDENDVDLGEKVFSIEYPSHFVNPETTFHVILSDASGNFLDSKTYKDIEDTISLYSKQEFNDNTSFTLTFISSFDNAIYSLYVYSNITKAALGELIVFQPGSFPLSTSLVDIQTKELNDHILNAKGHGYAMTQINNKLSGHYSPKFNQNLGPENIFVKYYDPNDVLNDSYKYILTNSIDGFSELNEFDLKNDQIESKQLSTNRPENLPLLLMYGYENEKLFNQISGHQIYDTYIPTFGFGGNHYYAFPNIFYKTSYSLSFPKYSLFGLGTPPATVNVPDETISSSFLNSNLTFSGHEGFEVGRIRLDNSDLNLNIEFIFDGSSKDIVIPTIPDDLISENIANTINDGKLRLVQAIAEDYHSFDSYYDYLENVFKNSTPFYLSSPTRERLYESYISTQLLPVHEFPHPERFR